MYDRFNNLLDKFKDLIYLRRVFKKIHIFLNEHTVFYYFFINFLYDIIKQFQAMQIQSGF